jgi:hypothetical protein
MVNKYAMRPALPPKEKEFARGQRKKGEAKTPRERVKR